MFCRALGNTRHRMIGDSRRVCCVYQQATSKTDVMQQAGHVYAEGRKESDYSETLQYDKQCRAVRPTVPFALLGCFIHHKKQKRCQEDHSQPFRHNVVANDTCSKYARPCQMPECLPGCSVPLSQ